MKLLYALIITLLVLVICLAHQGCQTVEKASSYLKKKDALDDLCAETFPVRDTVIRGDTLYTTDTLETFEILVDTLQRNDTVYITKTSPGKTIIKTIRVTDTIVRRDVAYENTLQDIVESLSGSNEKLLKKRDDWNEKHDKLKAKWKGKIGIPWWIIAIIIGVLVLRFKKQILSPFK